MNLRFSFAMAVLAGALALGASGRESEPEDNAAKAPAASPQTAPVLKGSEPHDSVLLTLPGLRVKPSPVVSVPAPQAVVEPANPGPAATLRPPALPVFPPEFQRDSAVFCQHRIAQWTLADAYNLFGEPVRERPAYSDNKAENGRIYAFNDPTGHYRSLELDFAAGTGILRTVFVYPRSMTWEECRKIWGGKVAATEANNGRTFYSYLNRHLDVLVDPAGKVVSLGLY
jgi:hypothetical protein